MLIAALAARITVQADTSAQRIKTTTLAAAAPFHNVPNQRTERLAGGGVNKLPQGLRGKAAALRVNDLILDLIYF